MMQVLPTYGTARSWIDTANSCFIQWAIVDFKPGDTYADIVLPINLNKCFALVATDVIYGENITSINDTYALSWALENQPNLRLISNTKYIGSVKVVVIGV